MLLGIIISQLFGFDFATSVERELHCRTSLHSHLQNRDRASSFFSACVAAQVRAGKRRVVRWLLHQATLAASERDSAATLQYCELASAKHAPKHCACRLVSMLPERHTPKTRSEQQPQSRGRGAVATWWYLLPRSPCLHQRCVDDSSVPLHSPGRQWPFLANKCIASSNRAIHAGRSSTKQHTQ